MKTTIRRAVACILSAALFGGVALPNACAQAIPTRAVLPAARARVAAFIERPEVARELAARGVSAQQAAARVAALSDAEVEALAAQIDRAPAGGQLPADVYLALTGVLIVAGLVIVAVVSLVRAVAHGIANAGKSQPQ